jgi:hypothetical protein
MPSLTSLYLIGAEDETMATTETKVQGTINETHLPQVRQCFGDKVAERLENAKPGDLFLDILFADYGEQKK